MNKPLRFINRHTGAQYLITKDPLSGWRITIFRVSIKGNEYDNEHATNNMSPVDHIPCSHRTDAINYLKKHFPHLEEIPYEKGDAMFQEGKRSDTLHISWDHGAINAAMGDLGMFNFQNTAKTLCGKRVGIEKISNHHPTCPNCLKQKEESERIAIKMLSDLSPEEKIEMLKKYPNIQKLLDKYNKE